MTLDKFPNSDSQLHSGGAIGDGADRDSLGPAFTYSRPKSLPLPVLIAVPHAGRAYPAKLLSKMRNAKASALRLEDRFVDLVGKKIARQTSSGLLIAHAPRAMLDLNRARDDVDWTMISGAARPGPAHSQANRRARSGLGLVPRRLPGSGDIWNSRLEAAELEDRIQDIHRPYHSFLARELEYIREQWGAALLIDLHSMPPLRRKNGQMRNTDIVIGDRFGGSCDSSLVSRALGYLDRQGVETAHNQPYSGGYVLDQHSAPTRGLHAIQIEVCRSTYLDENLVEPGSGLGQMAEILAGLVRELARATSRLGDAGQMCQAAE
ncbi:MAG: N-formylglutamate amidohydrolase [Erythrobacter sp.]